MRRSKLRSTRRRSQPAIAGRRLVFETLIGKGPYFNYLITLDNIVASRGGNPLMVGGKIVGAIGVSGGSGAQDNVLFLAGAGSLK